LIRKSPRPSLSRVPRDAAHTIVTTLKKLVCYPEPAISSSQYTAPFRISQSRAYRFPSRASICIVNPSTCPIPPLLTRPLVIMMIGLRQWSAISSSTRILWPFLMPDPDSRLEASAQSSYAVDRRYRCRSGDPSIVSVYPRIAFSDSTCKLLHLLFDKHIIYANHLLTCPPI